MAVLKQVTAYRANKILYNFIISNHLKGLVVLPANICPDVVDTLKFAGMDMCFVDISADTLCMDEQVVLSMARKATMVIFVHTYGIETENDTFFNRLKEENSQLSIVDDKCLCLPVLSESNGAISSDADLTLFSLGAKKQVNMGEGAIGFVRNMRQYDDVLVEKNDVLYNRPYRLEELAFFEEKSKVCNHKERINSIYRSCLPKCIQLPSGFQNWRFNIWVGNKDKVMQSIFEANLFASSHYKSQSSSCLVADSLHQHVINLFNDFYYSEDQAFKTCEIINERLKK